MRSVAWAGGATFTTYSTTLVDVPSLFCSRSEVCSTTITRVKQHTVPGGILGTLARAHQATTGRSGRALHIRSAGVCTCYNYPCRTSAARS